MCSAATGGRRRVAVASRRVRLNVTATSFQVPPLEYKERFQAKVRSIVEQVRNDVSHTDLVA